MIEIINNENQIYYLLTNSMYSETKYLQLFSLVPHSLKIIIKNNSCIVSSKQLLN